MCVCVCVFKKKRQCLSDPQANAEWTGGSVQVVNDSQLNDGSLSNQEVTFPLKLQWYDYLIVLIFYWYLIKLKPYISIIGIMIIKIIYSAWWLVL